MAELEDLSGYEEAGRRLAAAMISYNAGLSFQTVYKKYLENRPPGRAWLLAARWILKALAKQPQPPLVWGVEIQETQSGASNAEKENAIVNKHLIAMMTELQNEGFKSEAALAFIAFEGSRNFNLATLLDIAKMNVSVEGAMASLLEYAHDEICQRLDEVSEEVPPGEKCH